MTGGGITFLFGCGAGLATLRTGGSGTSTAKPGDTIALTWTFEARGRVAPGWKVFVHVDSGATGSTFVNGDHAPVRPFEWWQPGQFIRYTTNVTLPRVPGHYTVWAGLFLGDQRAHASAPHARVDKDAVAVATIEVR